MNKKKNCAHPCCESSAEFVDPNDLCKKHWQEWYSTPGGQYEPAWSNREGRGDLLRPFKKKRKKSKKRIVPKPGSQMEIRGNEPRCFTRADPNDIGKSFWDVSSRTMVQVTKSDRPVLIGTYDDLYGGSSVRLFRLDGDFFFAYGQDSLGYRWVY